MIHYDDSDGIMCLLSGVKRWYYIDKRHIKKLESNDCGWNVANESGTGYGEFALMDVDDIRPELWECYNTTSWYHADMEASLSSCIAISSYPCFVSRIHMLFRFFAISASHRCDIQPFGHMPCRRVIAC